MKAELVQYMGSDLTVVNAARVSFDKESEWASGTPFPKNLGDHKAEVKVLNEKDTKLIQYLSRNNHFTPFTHCTITLRESVPIFVARQRFKHTVGFSYNEVSRRYVDDDPEFYTPPKWRKRADNVKQGSSDEELDEKNFGIAFAIIGENTIPHAYTRFLDHAETFYKDLLEHGVAPEQARMVLPQSMFTSYYVTGSLAAFARAYSLRSESPAQLEIRLLASQWNNIIKPLFPVSWAALVNKE